jgi:hypothetical protein
MANGEALPIEPSTQSPAELTPGLSFRAEMARVRRLCTAIVTVVTKTILFADLTKVYDLLVEHK